MLRRAGSFPLRQMTSLVDIFLTNAASVANPVIGTTAVTLSPGGVILDGVWSMVTASGLSEWGGEQVNVTASVMVPASASVTRSLKGQRCTYNGIKLRVSNVEIGTVESLVLFEHETEALTA